MDKLKEIVRQKPQIFLIIGLTYVFLVGLLKWHMKPPLAALWYLTGAALGIYFLDLAETFFNLMPSPFRSIVFAAVFAAASFFVVTSSGNHFAMGLVLTSYLTIILWQVGEWRLAGNLDSWYRMVVAPVAVRTQLLILVAFVLLFFAQTYWFIR